jgi:hypothetical protein
VINYRAIDKEVLHRVFIGAVWFLLSCTSFGVVLFCV